MNKGTLFKPLPQPNIDDWQSDAAFVKHFLEGANPMVSKSFRFLFLLILESHIDTHTLPPTQCHCVPSQSRGDHLTFPTERSSTLLRRLIFVWSKKNICVVQKKLFVLPDIYRFCAWFEFQGLVRMLSRFTRKSKPSLWA